MMCGSTASRKRCPMLIDVRTKISRITRAMRSPTAESAHQSSAATPMPSTTTSEYHAASLDLTALRSYGLHLAENGQPVSVWVGVVPSGRITSKPSGVLSIPGAVPGWSVTPYCHTSAWVAGSMATMRSR